MLPSHKALKVSWVSVITGPHPIWVSCHCLTWPSIFAAGCADTIDIGEQSYSMVLADDLDNNGRLDLLVSTMNGNVYALETSAVYHPMKAWTSVVRQALLM